MRDSVQTHTDTCIYTVCSYLHYLIEDISDFLPSVLRCVKTSVVQELALSKTPTTGKSTLLQLISYTCEAQRPPCRNSCNPFIPTSQNCPTVFFFFPLISTVTSFFFSDAWLLIVRATNNSHISSPLAGTRRGMLSVPYFHTWTALFIAPSSTVQNPTSSE